MSSLNDKDNISTSNHSIYQQQEHKEERYTLSQQNTNNNKCANDNSNSSVNHDMPLLPSIEKQQSTIITEKMQVWGNVVEERMKQMIMKNTHCYDHHQKLRPICNNSNLAPSFLLSNSVTIQQQSRLIEAMLYAIAGPAKRIRPFILKLFANLYGVVDDNLYLDAAAAIELIHSYSLVHDDLPCMDNDKFRRGRLSCHAAFGENYAVLAGDALLTMAFETLIHENDSKTSKTIGSKITLDLLKVLTSAAGAIGMVGGQAFELEFVVNEDNDKHNNNKIIQNAQNYEIAKLKTGALFGAAAEMGMIIGNASDNEKKSAKALAIKLGILFQIIDDDEDYVQDMVKKTQNTKCKNHLKSDDDDTNATKRALMQEIKDNTRQIAHYALNRLRDRNCQVTTSNFDSINPSEITKCNEELRIKHFILYMDTITDLVSRKKLKVIL